MTLDKKALIALVEQTAHDVIDAGQLDLAEGARITADLLDDLVTNHSESGNFEELAQQVSSQIRLQVAIELWNLKDMAAKRFMQFVVTIARTLAVAAISA